MPKIIFLDSYYPQVLQSLPKVFSYEQRVEQLRMLHFGTAYYYSDAFKKMGWEAEDVVVNDTEGINLAMPGRFNTTEMLALNYVLNKKPDVLYFQDLSIWSDEIKRALREMGIKLVAQHSCPWAGNNRVASFDLVFSSFPHYLPRISALGVQAEFLPIAFGEQVLDYVAPRTRDIDVSFVGGVGGGVLGNGHWDRGTQLLEAVAKNFGDSFHWYGYGVDNLPPLSALRSCYRGSAWGIEQYEIYARSKIVVNRHGEVAQGYSNNMRMFEATGCGAALFTENSKNLNYYFSPHECFGYDNAEDLVNDIRFTLEDPWELEEVANAGQARTLKDHTYTKRLEDAEPYIRRLLK